MENNSFTSSLYQAIPLLERHMDTSEQRYITLVLGVDTSPKIINPWIALCDPGLMASAPIDIQYHFLDAAMSAPLSVLSVLGNGSITLGLFDYASLSALVVSDWYVRAYRNGLVKDVVDSDNSLLFVADERDGSVSTPLRAEYMEAHGVIDESLNMVYINSNGDSWTRQITA